MATLIHLNHHLAPSTVRRKRKYSRDRLLKNLQIIGALAAPLPPDLPPSTSSRGSAGPSQGSKRRFESPAITDPIKRIRTDDAHHPSRPSQQAQLPLPSSSRQPRFDRERAEPSEDGEVREESAAANPSSVTSSRWHTNSAPLSAASQFVPVRRPKRGRPSTAALEQLYERYHQSGRMLKYSGDARFWSTYPSTHKEYRPLPNPPPTDSPYHKFGGLIARLELLDALVCFTYSIWSKDFSRRTCVKETWATTEAFLFWCKNKWAADDTVGEREKMFIGLIWMIEAFIHARKLFYASHETIEPRIDHLVSQCQTDIATAMTAVEGPTDTTASTTLAVEGKNPQMLPSPPSIAPANSANSTPSSRLNGTPTATTGTSPVIRPPQPAPSARGPVNGAHPGTNSGNLGKFAHPNLPIPIGLFPTNAQGVPCIPEPGTAAFTATAKVTTTIPPATLWTLHNLTSSISATSYCHEKSSMTLTLPLLARHFPATFARMMDSSLQPSEEYEPDMEDCEGELFWPGHGGAMGGGEGLGWVCLMGKSMIREFGKEIGYKGLDGVVPKPKLEEGATQALGQAQVQPAPR